MEFRALYDNESPSKVEDVTKRISRLFANRIKFSRPKNYVSEFSQYKFLSSKKYHVWSLLNNIPEGSLFITKRRICSNIFGDLAGQGDAERKVAVMTTGGIYGLIAGINYLSYVGTHELAHALGLEHCENICIMKPRSSRRSFCPDCNEQLEVIL